MLANPNPKKKKSQNPKLNNKTNNKNEPKIFSVYNTQSKFIILRRQKQGVAKQSKLNVAKRKLPQYKHNIKAKVKMCIFL